MRHRQSRPVVLALSLTAATAFAACGGDEEEGLVEAPGAATEAGASDAGGSRDGAAAGPGDAATKADGGAVDAGPTQSGEATYYDADGVGACGFPTSDAELLAAMNGAQYSKAVCGKCVEVAGPLGTVVVRIADKCPGCKSGDLDLSQTAFQKIAKLSAGRVPITWRFVACP